MGVTRTTSDLFTTNDNLEDFDCLHVSTDEEGSIHNVNNSRRSTRRPRPSRHILSRDDYQTSRKRLGSKPSRRCENLRHLLTLAEKDDIEDVEFDTVFEPKLTVFAQLLNEKEKMKVWNDFINRTEEDQNQILMDLEFKTSLVNLNDTPIPEHEAELEDWENLKSGREAHPAYSAEECFSHIDKKFRVLLKQKRIPLGMLQNLEDDIVSFFTDWPSSIYVVQLASSFERMMVHALCKYLSLKSQSFDNDGKRQTQVENKKADFVAPAPLLTDFIERTFTR